MNIEDLIKLSSVFINAPEDEMLLTKLVEAKGYKTELAERFVAFMPIAFGRVVIKQLGEVSFTSTYIVKEDGNEYSLTDEPLYCLAQSLAVESYENGTIGREVFSAIATRSAEIGSVNKALNEGIDINGAKFSPILLFGYKTLGKKQGLFGGIFS